MRIGHTHICQSQYWQWLPKTGDYIRIQNTICLCYLHIGYWLVCMPLQEVSE